jgi:hypothetical protein
MKQIFVVYDDKSEAYLQPVFMDTKGQFLRAIADTVADPNHNFNRHAEDFTCYYLGEYDEHTAEFKMNPSPVSLGKCIEFKASHLAPTEVLSDE